MIWMNLVPPGARIAAAAEILPAAARRGGLRQVLDADRQPRAFRGAQGRRPLRRQREDRDRPPTPPRPAASFLPPRCPRMRLCGGTAKSILRPSGPACPPPRTAPPAAWTPPWTPARASAMIRAANHEMQDPCRRPIPCLRRTTRTNPIGGRRRRGRQLPAAALPARADVVVVGSGYTGLSRGLADGARRPPSRWCIDAEDAGWGCSSRNGGQVSTSIKPSHDELSALYGPERAFRILKEGHDALAWLGDFIAGEGIDCQFERVGRFHAAHNPAQYEAAGQEAGPSAEGPGGRSPHGAARRAAERARHRRLSRRRRL